MGSKPKITIVTPSYNQGQYIEDTILSVINQGYGNLEYIVIDGGSSDQTIDVIRQYEKYLAYWVSESDDGQSDAINKGFEKGTGEILCWLNSDDILWPNALEKVASLMGDSNEAWLIGNAFSLSSSGSIGKMRRTKGVNYETFLKYKQDWFPQPSVFWKRELWENVGALNSQLNYIMDLDIFWKMFQLKRPIITQEVLSGYRIHKSAKTTISADKVDEEYMQWLIGVMKENPSYEEYIIKHYIELQRSKRVMDEHIIFSRLATFWKKYINSNIKL